MKSLKKILVTGLPRSGTTLTCRLLSQVDNVIALQEPMKVSLFGKLDSPKKIFTMIDDFFEESRRSALEQGQILTKNIKGEITDNYYQDPHEGDPIRKNRSQRSFVKLKRKPTPDMTIIIKHNAAFTALLPDLDNKFPVFAIIRNPLWTMASWNSNKLPIYDGHIPMGEQLDGKLAADLAGIPDRIDRQIHILSWMFDRYSMINEHRSIRYEDLVDSRGKILQAIVPQAYGLDEDLTSENRTKRYPNAPLAELKERLTKVGGTFLDFYPEESLVYMER